MRKRATYYIEETQIEQINQIAIVKDSDSSKLVRRALDNFISANRDTQPNAEYAPELIQTFISGRDIPARVTQPNWAGNHPECFFSLSIDKKIILLQWINEKITPQKTINKNMSSYDIKHQFSHDTGLYITNGQFKGAMLTCGYLPDNAHDVNWCFRIKTIPNLRTY